NVFIKNVKKRLNGYFVLRHFYKLVPFTIYSMKKYPMNAIDSDKNVAKQAIPKEYLCPVSNSIMTDPVIALNEIAYDRSSIMNQYQIFQIILLYSFVCMYNFYFFKKKICNKSF
ncbi:hypothetical protein RFI_38611, partial [Reticulomyxa filosa]